MNLTYSGLQQMVGDKKAKELWASTSENQYDITSIEGRLDKQIAELSTNKGKSKYKNDKKCVDGIQFDSKMEASRYVELRLMEKSGGISHLVLQPEFILQEKFECCGVKYRAVIYKADFQYMDMETGDMVVEDVKGFKTQV